MSDSFNPKDFPRTNQENFYDRTYFSSAHNYKSITREAPSHSIAILNYFNQGIEKVIPIVYHENYMVTKCKCAKEEIPMINAFYDELQQALKSLTVNENPKIGSIEIIKETGISKIVISKS